MSLISKQIAGPIQYTDLQDAASADGNGKVGHVEGLNGAVLIEVENLTGTGSCDVTLQGQFSFSPADQWYNLGYQRVDNQATLTRLVGSTNIGAGIAMVFQVLDYYDTVRVAISNTAGTIVLNANVRGLAV